ncbi:hypothetical protein [Proteiniclasticum sp.]|uniref:hypothetical protein n=1 Tax=Proteiniclasticum sp. TaxID=2053595 RepID=UPI00289E0C2C|nr:hypothetical protein [Proteiniclasticum sp.]
MSSFFNSFWMGGFECSDQLNVHGDRVDLLFETRHLVMLEEDYRNIGKMGIKTVREGIRWSKVEVAPYVYNWEDVVRIMNTAHKTGIQIIWDLCHFGYPEDLSPLHPKFTTRFVSMCKAFTELHQVICPGERLMVVPINEVSFFSWLGGDASGTSPYCIGLGWTVKYHLMKAFIQGVEAIRSLEPTSVIILSEPLIRITTDNEDPDYIEEVKAISENQFQVADILCGRICQELGGKPEYLDVMGLNYYYPNQWNYETGRILDWKKPEEEMNYIPLSQLLVENYTRYRKPLMISETSSVKEDRPEWIHMISENVRRVMALGCPILGVCIYPILDRPDWDELDFWHHSGLWDNETAQGGSERVLYEAYAAAIREEILKHQVEK